MIIAIIPPQIRPKTPNITFAFVSGSIDNPSLNYGVIFI
jgi:hypothetical protein